MAALSGQHRRQAPATPDVMLHRQMRETRVKRWRWVQTQTAKGKNGDEAGQSCAPTDGQLIWVKFKFYLGLKFK
jgi:hypothetical protein